jgi:CheY-like chemotaxis protein
MSSKARVLVVDDNRSLVRVIEGILQRQGYEVLTAFDGVEGFEKAKKEKPDLIILDIVMPKMDGYEACRHLQRNPSTAEIPILMLTVKGQVNEAANPEDQRDYYDRIRERLAGFDAGALEFLSKPVTAKELVKQVQRLLWFAGA